MAAHFYEVSLYKVGLLTTVASWLFYKSGGTNRLPRFEMIGGNGGFFVVHGLIFLGIWFVIYFFERNLGIPPFFRSIRSRQGTALWLDVVTILTAGMCLLFSFGFGTLSGYQVGGALLLAAAAAQSLLIGREFQFLLGPIFPGGALSRAAAPSPPIATPPDEGMGGSALPPVATPPNEDMGSAPPPVATPPDEGIGFASPPAAMPPGEGIGSTPPPVVTPPGEGIGSAADPPPPLSPAPSAPAEVASPQPEEAASLASSQPNEQN